MNIQNMQLNDPAIVSPRNSQESTLQPMEVYRYQTIPLEAPFGWRTESFLLKRLISFYPSGSDLTISFETRRSSKYLGYLPLIGTIIGVIRIFKGIQERQYFQSIHLHSLSQRSSQWVIRGSLELVPVVGGLTCMIADLAMTILSIKKPNVSHLPDATPCGFCHSCGFCEC